MANLLDCVENSVWHAFDFLALEGDGTAPKSKLKTLTIELGKVLDLSDVDNGLDDYRSTSSLSFEQYRFYLFKEVFSALPDEMTTECQHRYESALDSVCWSMCSSNYLERDHPVFPEDCVYKLFRVFCMLADMVENDKGQIEVIMSAGEVENAAYQFVLNLGRGPDWDPEEFDSVANVIEAFKFGIFLTVLESKYARDVDEGGMREAVRDVHDFYLLDVVKKGRLGKRMDVLPAFREHFFVLQPHKLTFYNGSSQKEKRGEIPLDAQCRSEAVPDSSSKSPIKTPGSKHHSRFQLFANEKTLEFQASDHRTRLQWFKALNTAIEHSGALVRYQRQLLDKRRLAREEEKEREDELETMENDIGVQLENEKKMRVNAEEKAETLARQREVEEVKMREMEKIREQLENLLQEERQAKKDEEIVRTLQARILNEEWARRETLEQLQEEQKNLLEAERRKREEFEKLQAEKERQLRDAQAKVEEMERERRKLDKQLDAVQEKTKKANLGQEVLEAKIKVKEQEQLVDKESASRVTSLNPSASFYVRSCSRGADGGAGGAGGGRPSYTPMRSASMRETSYSRSIRRRGQRSAAANNNSHGDTLSVNRLGVGSSSTHNVAIEEVTANGHEE